MSLFVSKDYSLLQLLVLSLDSVCSYFSELFVRMHNEHGPHVCKHSLVAMLPNYCKCIVNNVIISLTCAHTHCRQEPTQAPSHAHLLIHINIIHGC